MSTGIAMPARRRGSEVEMMRYWIHRQSGVGYIDGVGCVSHIRPSGDWTEYDRDAYYRIMYGEPPESPAEDAPIDGCESGAPVSRG
jgi:hypothetical protein